MSHRSLNDDPLLSEKRYSSSYGIKESRECDVLASDAKSVSRSQSGSDSPPPDYQSTLNKERVWSVAMCALIACLASLLNGMMLGFSSPALKQLQFNVSEEFQLDPTNVKYSLFGVGAYNLSFNIRFNIYLFE